MVTNISSSSVCQTKDSITTNVGTTAMNIDTSIKSETVIELRNGFQLTNEGLRYDPSWSNTHYSPISESLTTKEWINMKENILDINVIVPGKVMVVTFDDDRQEKLVCQVEDHFSLRRGCFIAIAKHLYKNTYTSEGVEHVATEMSYQIPYVKIVNKAIKNYSKKCEKKAKEKQLEAEKKEAAERKRAKREAYKERRKVRLEAERNESLKAERAEMVDIIAEAIKKSKE